MLSFQMVGIGHGKVRGTGELGGEEVVRDDSEFVGRGHCSGHGLDTR